MFGKRPASCVNELPCDGYYIKQCAVLKEEMIVKKTFQKAYIFVYGFHRSNE